MTPWIHLVRKEAKMGLLDILNGMQHGPRGQPQPSGSGGTSGSGGGGMSPLMLALLGLLAYKALKGSGGQAPAPGGAGRAPSLAPGDDVHANNPGGGLGDILGGLLGGAPSGRAGGRPSGGSLADMLPGGLGGLLGGAAAGSVVSGGLGNLIKDLQQSGQGRAAQSWVSTGPNEEIAPDDLEKAVGLDTLESLSRQTGMGREDLLAGLSRHLPDLVNQLTPKGRLPTDQEASRLV
jgi:uncharacterized protein YidB (DUF937 family)